MADSNGNRRNARKGRTPARRAARKDRKAASPTKPVPPDLLTIMEHFSRALSLVIVCHRSLAAQPSADVGDEEETLRRAIRLLKDVYNEIDLASMVMTGK
jgi:hypothetical protein